MPKKYPKHVTNLLKEIKKEVKNEEQKSTIKSKKEDYQDFLETQKRISYNIKIQHEKDQI